MRSSLLLLSAVLVLAVATSAYAITYGQPDGGLHPNVGVLVYKSPSRNNQYRLVCSGSLISKTIFLTASHCTSYLEANGIHDVWVSFDPTFNQASTFYHGQMHTNPLYNQRQSDPEDIAVVELDSPVSGITPAKLPTLGQLDGMKKTLNGTRFTSVGYGDPNVGPDALSSERWFSTGGFNALTNVWLKLSGNPSHGDGGTCYGDSGGPQFLGDTDTQVSITITGDAVCRATNVDYRLDTPQARAFLRPFGVPLP